MNGNEIVKTTGNVFVYNYILCHFFFFFFFHESGSFTFFRNVFDLFSKIQGFNAQNCKICIPKSVSFFQNIPEV